MTQKQIENAKAYLAAGLDLNRTAAIMMISKEVIEQHINVADFPVHPAILQKNKSKKVNKNEDL